MKLKIHKHQKSNFKILNKKSIVLFLSIVFVSFISGQTLKIDKQKAEKPSVEKSTTDKSIVDKQSITDKQKTDKLVVDKQKAIVQKDTVKKPKVLTIEEQEMVLDSLLMENGDFKFYKKSAYASYYASKFHGKRTASGKKYDQNKFTAAHKKLPFGTKVKVTNEVNGKTVIVEITDRGPFVKSREIDLSRRAFMDIARNKGAGIMKVTIEVLQK